jgi:hypothetical protein
MNASAYRHPLLALDPDLGRLLDGERLQSARSQLSVRALSVSVGEGDLTGLGGVGPGNAGLLIVDGVIARELALGDTVSSELMGEGDLVRPWTLDDAAPLVQAVTGWNVLSPLRVAILDAPLSSRLNAYPEVMAVLVDRLNARSQRLALLQAIGHLNRVDARLEILLWMLAERWGRVTADGVVVPLALSHRGLGQLVGARRPTVSTALSKLARSRRVTRRPDGTWLLQPEFRPSVVPAADAFVRQRRRLFGVGDAATDAPAIEPGSVDDVWTAIEALHERSRVQGEDVELLRGEIAALHHRVRMASGATGARARMRA